ncbi:MAG: alpha/beta hydrolase [Sphingomonas paucimobilis]
MDDAAMLPVRGVETRAGVLGVIVEGRTSTGLPILLLHGGGMDRASISWARLIGPLSVDRMVIAPDLPGFGASLSLPPAGSAAAMAAVVLDMIDRIGVDRVVVAGVSMGGDVAMNLALLAPARVAGLVLVAPGGLASVVRNRAVQVMAWATAQLPDALLLPLVRQGNRFVRQIVRWMVKDVATLPPDIVERFVAEAGREKAGVAYLRYNQASLGPARMRNDLSGRIGAIAVPTLFVHGADDAMVDPADSRRAASRMRQARLVIIPDCGHWAQVEAADRFMVELDRFLSENGL